MDQARTQTGETSETGARVNAAAEWRSRLTGITGALLLYETITGLTIFLLPFSRFNQFSVLLHTLLGIAMLLPVGWYTLRHWRVRRKGNLSHYQVLGYIAVAFLVACAVSGLYLTWQGIVGPAISYGWDLVHLVTGVGMALFIIVHLATVIVRKVKNPEALRTLRGARRTFYRWSLLGCGAVVAATAGWAAMVAPDNPVRAFPDDYNWAFGEDRPFAPSLARLDHADWTDDVHQRVLELLEPGGRQTYLASFENRPAEPIGFFQQVRESAGQLGLSDSKRSDLEAILADAAVEMKARGAVDPRALAGSAGCGTSGCHSEIYEEWLPSAHRYSALDDMFQRVQELMAVETSPQHTRYCAGCHDPISLLGGAKSEGNITLSTVGSDEGSSCLVCHSIVQTDVQGNGDYTIRPPQRYVYETDEGPVAKFLSDFLIRTYPKQHIDSYSRPLYKTPEFCAACHKQYLDTEVNTDIGKVQGQNQYDSWKNSRWFHEDDMDRTINCRECHMPLVHQSTDPARGDVTDYNRTRDDGRHRSHRMLASNQYIPVLQNLANAEEHVRLTEEWLRGEIEIPEIADKWTTGPVVRMSIIAPEEVNEGDDTSLQVILTNNKTGHDFPTGPLDMIESWVELKVTDDRGEVVYHTGYLDEDGRIIGAQIWFKADGFDREGELIDRHNLWDLVGASYKRSMYPGVTDTMQVQFQCPSMARGRVRPGDEKLPPGQRREDFEFQASEGSMNVEAVLWYRKANPEFLDRVYGTEPVRRAPATAISEASATIRVNGNGETRPE